MSTPTDDWLPHDPTPVAPARGSSGKTIAIWAGLVACFVAIYNLAGGGGPRDPRTGYSGWWIAAAVALTILAVVLLLVWVFGGAKRFNARATPGLEALAAGRHAEAAELFRQLQRRYRGQPNFAAVAAYNRGYALLRAGDTAAAAGILLGVDRTPKLGLGGVRKLSAVALARCFAIAGDVDKAQRWLDAARARPVGMADPVHDRAVLDALAGLVLCRQGKLDEARAHYEQCSTRLAAYLPVHQMTEVWLLRAFATAAASGPRDAGTAEPWLRMLRGTPPGELAWLTARWPELATFVTTHELAA